MKIESHLAFPDDLRERLDESALLKALFKAEAVYRPHRSPVGVVPDSQPTFLLILGFSYLTGCYASEEIEEACHRDAVLKSLCRHGGFPEAPLLRTFRRWHHAELLALLRTAIELVVEMIGGSAPSDSVCGGTEEEARRRIEAGMLADTGALDL